MKKKIMERNNKVATLRPVAASTMGESPTVKQSSVENGVFTSAERLDENRILEDHRTLMTRGELIFCLHDVHSYWSTPCISYHEIEELEQQNLIQRNTAGICAIRLTEQGALVKNWQQLKAP